MKSDPEKIKNFWSMSPTYPTKSTDTLYRNTDSYMKAHIEALIQGLKKPYIAQTIDMLDTNEDTAGWFSSDDAGDLSAPPMWPLEEIKAAMRKLIA